MTSSTAPGPLPGSGGATALALPDARWVTDGTDRRTATRRQPRVSRRVGIVAGSLALITMVGGGGLYAAYVTIPRATITLVQQAHELEPADLTLQVKEGVATDVAAGVVGGRRLAVPAAVAGTVTASGTGQPLTARARGTVTFFNHSVNPIPIADQTIVSTTNGIAFETQNVVTVPPGGPMDVEVAAVDAGPGGNVDPGAITVMPDELRINYLNGGTVINKEATTGGQSLQQRVILETDYDNALADLDTRLRAELAQQAANPPLLPSDGIVYLATVTPGQLTTSPTKEQLVGQPVASAAITASMTGSVLTSSVSEITDVATQMLQANALGTAFVPGSIRITTGDPVIGDDGTVAYHATASGRAFDRQLDTQKVAASVKGMTVSEAHVILDLLGKATITLSPDFMPALPDDPDRIEVKLTPLGSPPP